MIFDTLIYLQNMDFQRLKDTFIWRLIYSKTIFDTDIFGIIKNLKFNLYHLNPRTKPRTPGTIPRNEETILAH